VHHYRFPYMHVSYYGAGHMILPPYTPAITYSTHPVDHNLYAYGGNQPDYADAGVDSWAEILRFLAANLKK